MMAAQVESEVSLLRASWLTTTYAKYSRGSPNFRVVIFTTPLGLQVLDTFRCSRSYAGKLKGSYSMVMTKLEFHYVNTIRYE